MLDDGDMFTLGEVYVQVSWECNMVEVIMVKFIVGKNISDSELTCHVLGNHVFKCLK